MEKITYKAEYRKIERFLLSIYSIYSIVLMVSSIDCGWNSWISIMLGGGMAICWIVYVGKIKSYEFRARFSAIIMQITLIVYTVQLDNASLMMPIFMAFVVFMGLYGIADIIYITVVSMALIFIREVVANGVSVGLMQGITSMLLQAGNVCLLQYVVYLWTKRNSEGSRKLLGVINELKEVENSKDDFLANVSHEIRTPINTICGISEIVLQEKVPEKIKENLQDIQAAGRNLMSLVSDILDFSELQSGKMELEEEAYNITSTVNDVINMSMAQKNEKNIELIIDCDANIPSVLYGDEKKIRRVILKLVDNAIKFTDVGGVSICIGYRKESYGINLVVTVKDTGIGIEEESLETLFTSFSQVDTSRNRQNGGVGLGLAISYALVKKMGGAITVKSKPGKGSVIQFVVPQKVLDEEPIVSIENKEKINVATYIDMEQFSVVDIRDEYSNSIVHMVEQLKARCHVCRNIGELQRRARIELFSHVFISIAEYKRDVEYFDDLSRQTQLIIILDRKDEKEVNNSRIIKIYKPFYILSIVSVLNGLTNIQGENSQEVSKKFVTRGVRILAVDDNRMNLRVIAGFLEDYDISVTTAVSGREALEKIMTEDFDFVFMDHMMPEMDGVETMRHIRHKVGAYFQKVPIIALTANAVAGTREMLLAEGFNDFLEKPVERSVLERVLKRNIAPEKIVYQKELDEIKKENVRDKVKEETAVLQNVVEKVSNIPDIFELERILAPKGLEVQQGILYCNGLERYVDVLKGYCEESDDLGKLAEELYVKKDWKNYVITVHGMKSAMRSIGAIKISEMARKLEYAGKEGKTGYILDNHDELLEEYQKLFEGLKEYDWIVSPDAEGKKHSKEEDDVEKLQFMEDDLFEQKIKEMEEAMYDLDGEKLMEILSEMENYQYKGKSLKVLFGPVRRKVEMADYVSAVEMAVRLKNGVARSDK